MRATSFYVKRRNIRNTENSKHQISSNIEDQNLNFQNELSSKTEELETPRRYPRICANSLASTVYNSLETPISNPLETPVSKFIPNSTCAFFIKSITESVRRIMPRNFFRSNFFKPQLDNFVPEKTLSDSNNNRQNNLIATNYAYESYRPTIPSNLKMDENFCLSMEIKNIDFSPPMENVQKYMKLKNAVLRRSRTTFITQNAYATCSMQQMLAFFEILEDPLVFLFLKRDACRIYADKYLIAMALIYFIRAKLSLVEYTRYNFFAALYLAHDMEEDNEKYKYEIFPFALGKNWRRHYPYLLSMRDQLFWTMQCRAVVARRCCDQVMSMIPTHWVWKRERPEVHGYVSRIQWQNENEEPRGPYELPFWCKSCLKRECEDSENSYVIYTSPEMSASSDNNDSITEAESENYESSPAESEKSFQSRKKFKKDSGFESFIADQSHQSKQNLTLNDQSHQSKQNLTLNDQSHQSKQNLTTLNDQSEQDLILNDQSQKLNQACDITHRLIQDHSSEPHELNQDELHEPNQILVQTDETRSMDEFLNLKELDQNRCLDQQDQTEDLDHALEDQSEKLMSPSDFDQNFYEIVDKEIVISKKSLNTPTFNLESTIVYGNF